MIISFPKHWTGRTSCISIALYSTDSYYSTSCRVAGKSFYEINAAAAAADDDNCSIYILLELSVRISSSKTVNIKRIIRQNPSPEISDFSLLTSTYYIRLSVRHLLQRGCVDHQMSDWYRRTSISTTAICCGQHLSCCVWQLDLSTELRKLTSTASLSSCRSSCSERSRTSVAPTLQNVRTVIATLSFMAHYHRHCLNDCSVQGIIRRNETTWS